MRKRLRMRMGFRFVVVGVLGVSLCLFYVGYFGLMDELGEHVCGEVGRWECYEVLQGEPEEVGEIVIREWDGVLWEHLVLVFGGWVCLELARLLGCRGRFV